MPNAWKYPSYGGYAINVDGKFLRNALFQPGCMWSVTSAKRLGKGSDIDFLAVDLDDMTMRDFPITADTSCKIKHPRSGGGSGATSEGGQGDGIRPEDTGTGKKLK